jgi:hypothetical protein
VLDDISSIVRIYHNLTMSIGSIEFNVPAQGRGPHRAFQVHPNPAQAEPAGGGLVRARHVSSPRLRQFVTVRSHTDYVCLGFALYTPAPEPLGDRFSSDVGWVAKPRGIPCLDLVSQWCSLAIRDRWNLKKFCPTASRQRNDLG